MKSCRLNEFSKMNNDVKRNKITLGKKVFITGDNSIIYTWEGLENSNEKSNLIIKNYVSISNNCNFLMGGNHRLDWFCQHLLINNSDIKNDEIISKGDIIIGNDVWIGFNSTILSGTYIPDGCIIGTNSVVSGDKFESYDIIVGNPAISIKKRFDMDTIKILLELKWWDWNDEKIKKYSHILKSNNIEELKNIIIDEEYNNRNNNKY